MWSEQLSTANSTATKQAGPAVLLKSQPRLNLNRWQWFSCSECGSEFFDHADWHAERCEDCLGVELADYFEATPSSVVLGNTHGVFTGVDWDPSMDVHKRRFTEHSCSSCGGTFEDDPHWHAEECPGCRGYVEDDPNLWEVVQPWFGSDE